MSKFNIFKISPNITSTVGWSERYLELFFGWYFPAASVEQQIDAFQQLKESYRVTSKPTTQTIIFVLVSTFEQNRCNHKSHTPEQFHIPLHHNSREEFGWIWFCLFSFHSSLLLSVMGSLQWTGFRYSLPLQKDGLMAGF